MDRNTCIDQIKHLLPPAAARPRGVRMILTRALGAATGEPAAADSRSSDLADEIDPRTATETLSDWERVLGLPDDCTAGLGLVLQERRNVAHAKLTARGGQSRRSFTDLAARLGFKTTITEFRPFQAGRSRAGDPVYAETWRFVWRIHAPATTIRKFRCGRSAAGDPLRRWGNRLMECAINRRKPAHTTVIFTYGE